MYKNKHIFIINGAAGSGKDSFVDYVKILSKEFVETGDVVNFSSVDEIKKVAKNLGWTGQKDEKDRKFLSDLKSLTTKYCDFSFKSMIHVVSDFLKSLNESILFLHIREPEEIERAKIAFNAKTLLITRIGVTPIKSNNSDAKVHDYKYDVVIRNDQDLEALKTTAAIFLSDVIDNEVKSEYFCCKNPTLSASPIVSTFT